MPIAQPPISPVMETDPALPVYQAAMSRISVLMRDDPENGTPLGDELHALVDLVECYERRWFPQLYPAKR